MTIEEVTKKHEKHLLGLPNVTGIGIGEKDGHPVVLVFVRKKLPESALAAGDIVPKTLEGYETDVQPEIRIGPNQDR